MKTKKNAGRESGADMSNQSSPHDSKPWRKFTDFTVEIVGQEQGDCFVADMQRGGLEPDDLFLRVLPLTTQPPRLRGFCRALQKFLEKRAA